MLFERKNKERVVAVVAVNTTGRSIVMGEELATYDKVALMMVVMMVMVMMKLEVVVVVMIVILAMTMVLTMMTWRRWPTMTRWLFTWMTPRTEMI